MPESYDIPDVQLSTSRVGKVLADRYRLDRWLGGGGMGDVYAATHLLLRKPVAVKVLHPSLATSSELVARFQREAQAAANIAHPNVCAASDFGRATTGELFIVMELIDGVTLTEAIRHAGVLAPGRAVHIARQVCAALEQAHAAGVVHRDLKPENMMLVEQGGDADFVKLLDFGIARVRLAGEDSAAITRVGAVYGTPQYMAPEQAAGGTVGLHADLYSLGVVMFEMLTGRLPFVSDDTVAIIRMHMMRRPPDVRQFVPAVPVGLSEVVARLLRKSADDRYANAGELKAVLEALDLTDVPSPPPVVADAHRLAQVAAAATVDLELEVPEISPRVGRLIPREMARRYSAVPIWQEGERLVIAMSDPTDAQALAEIAFLTGFSVEALGASEEVIAQALSRFDP